MPKQSDADNPTRTNLSSDKLLALLELLARQEEPVRLQELARQLSMPSSTVLRFLSALQNRDYVAQDIDTGRYFLTFKLCGLADSIRANQNLRNIGLPFLRNVSAVFDEATNLSIECDMAVMYIEAVRGPSKTLMSLQRIGNIAPMHCTGVGKLLLLEYTAAQLDRLIAVKGLTRFTASTLTSREQLEAELAQVRAQGYAYDNEECEEGARCIAAPIRDYTGRIVAGISVSGPVTRMTDSHIEKNLPALLDAARQISSRLGWPRA
ncbi:MAG: IclR family transcriptional regulator [Oscillospiraceae bacterium]